MENETERRKEMAEKERERNGERLRRGLQQKRGKEWAGGSKTKDK